MDFTLNKIEDLVKNDQKRIALIVSLYPTDENPNALGFVHSRVRAYLRDNINVDVYRVSKRNSEYWFDGVHVFSYSPEKIVKALACIDYDIILTHFLDKNKMNIIGNRECLVWVHGFEALSWKRRLFNISPRLPLTAIENHVQLVNFRKYAENNKKAKYVFVSKWMHDITCKDIRYNITNCSIIPNYIDSNIFEYQEKTAEQRKKFLLIRSFENRKYANDISVKIIQELNKKEYADELHFCIYGKGKLFEKTISRLKQYKNVEIHNTFLTQQEIAQIQKAYGIFLCPTRQDAQGVSMCEAMSSGLVPIASNNTAIPEFLSDKEGILGQNNDIQSFIRAYEKIFYNPKLFLEMSSAAHNRINYQCGYENTILKEIELMD